jgi:hypothetical protein
MKKEQCTCIISIVANNLETKSSFRFDFQIEQENGSKIDLTNYFLDSDLINSNHQERIQSFFFQYNLTPASSKNMIS